MYFSGSEFHNKLLAMSGIFETKKKWFPKDDKHIGSKYFFGAKAKFFSIQSNVNSKSRLINFCQPTHMSKFRNLLQQTMSSLQNMSNWQLYQSFTDINNKL